MGHEVATAGPAKLEVTLTKGIRVLEALASSAVPLGISALSSQLGLGKSNVHRMLTTLGHLGLVQQEEGTKRYFATLRIWELGTLVVERNLVRREARAVMQELVATTGESTYLSVLRDAEILYLEKVEGKNGAHSNSRPGLRVPAVYPASGKLLLALQPNWEAVAARAAEVPASQPRPDVAALLADLRQIRADGFATSQDGWQRGINSLAVAVGSPTRPPVAALGFAIMPSNWEPKRLEKYLALLRQAAERISAMSEADSRTEPAN